MSYAEAECTRVYLPRGHVAHLLGPLDSPNFPTKALCGRHTGPDWDPWIGTGSQREQDRAASLRLCRDCASCVESGRP